VDVIEDRGENLELVEHRLLVEIHQDDAQVVGPGFHAHIDFTLEFLYLDPEDTGRLADLDPGLFQGCGQIVLGLVQRGAADVDLLDPHFHGKAKEFDFVLEAHSISYAMVPFPEGVIPDGDLLAHQREFLANLRRPAVGRNRPFAFNVHGFIIVSPSCCVCYTGLGR
jgi:hypothetical protein